MKKSANGVASPSSAPRISVAMATYNGQKHIREQLDSIARQTLLPLEIVITDDGSTDATLQIVEEFTRAAPFAVRVFRNQTRLGYADNFMRAASLCAGDVIAFCDQDDIWLEQKLSVCGRFFVEEEVVLAAHSAWTLLKSGERGHLHPHFPQTQILEAGSGNPFHYPYGFAMIISRELLTLADVAMRPGRVSAHDQWFWFLATSAGRVATIAEPLALYRQHETNAFGAPQRLTFAERLRRTAGIIDFDGAADTELECARILAAAAEKHPERRNELRKSAQNLEYRSRLHRLRTRIYDRRATFLDRAITFSRILCRGGYLPDSSGTRFGISHAMKDMLLGVLGTYKISAPQT